MTGSAGLVARSWRRIAVVAGITTAVALAYVLVAPKWYRTRVTIVPVKPPRAGGEIASLLGGELSDFASGLDLGGGGQAVDVQRIAAVLQSDTVTDAVIAKFDLKERYGERYQENTRKELWDHCAVKPLAKASLVQLTCEDKDPRFVQELLTYFAEYGNEVFRRVSVGSASEEVRFLERRAAELRKQAEEASSRMRAFQEQHQIVDIETQTKAVVSSIAGLRSQRIGKQVELDFARRFSSGEEATQQQLRAQLSVLDQALRDLSVAPGAEAPQATGGADGLFPRALAVPKLRAEYEALYRDRKLAETTLIFALERLEAARANEARDVSTFALLDRPALPTRHHWPKRVLTLVLAAILGALGALAHEWHRAGGRLGALLDAVLGPPSDRPAAERQRADRAPAPGSDR